ncbi:MAG: hypothetical protein OSA98_22760 [Rubripirellula sp.]|nr:hypothetical protein [Rubripirellula sp.]
MRVVENNQLLPRRDIAAISSIKIGIWRRESFRFMELQRRLLTALNEGISYEIEKQDN